MEASASGIAVEGFKRPVEVDRLDDAVGEMARTPAAELYAEPVVGPSLRSEVTALERAAEAGATLWVFEGPWPSWEGIAAVRGCHVVATAITANH